MIKLERNVSPIFLNPKFVKEKTDEFKTSGLSVWNIDNLKEALLKLSHGKCAYCECDLTEESKYMEVEHFENKDSNPDKVLEWDNLLPACKRCNGSKSYHDVIAEPIINPFIDNPKDDLLLHLFRLVSKTSKGQNSIEVLNLNDTERAVMKRFTIGNGLNVSIDILLEKLNLYKADKTTRRRNKLISCFESILKECQPDSIYSATCATVLHSNKLYNQVRIEMIACSLWNDELEALHNNSKEIILVY